MDCIDNIDVSTRPSQVFQSVPLKAGVNLNELREGEQATTFEIDEDRANQQQREEYGERELYEQRTGLNNKPEFNERRAGDVISLTDDGGVKKRILQRGSGRLPVKGDMVKVHYAAYAEDLDEPHDDTWLRNKPSFFHISKDESPSIVPGLHIGLKSMQRLEVSEIIVSPKYAYGEMGCPPRIPAQATITFQVHMLDILTRRDDTGLSGSDSDNEDNFLDLKQVTAEIVVKKVDAIRQVCKSMLSEKSPRYHQAWKQYRYALALLEKCGAANSREQTLLEEYLQSIYTNISLCLYNDCKFMGAASAAQQAIKLNSCNPKAHYWLGKSHLAQNHLDIAKRHLQRANALMPNSADIQKAFKELELRQKDAITTEREMCSKMFGFKKQSADEKTSSDDQSAGERSGAIPKAPRPPMSQQIIDDDRKLRGDPEYSMSGSSGASSLSSGYPAGSGASGESEEVEELLKKVSPEFQTMIIEKLSAFQCDSTQTTLVLPRMSLKQEELVCLASAADNMALSVKFNNEMNCIIVSKDD